MSSAVHFEISQVQKSVRKHIAEKHVYDASSPCAIGFENALSSSRTGSSTPTNSNLGRGLCALHLNAHYTFEAAFDDCAVIIVLRRAGFNAALRAIFYLVQSVVDLALEKSVGEFIIGVAVFGVLFLFTDFLEVGIGVTFIPSSQLFAMNACTSLCNLDSPSGLWAQLPQ